MIQSGFKDMKAVESFLLDQLSHYVELSSVTQEPRSKEEELYREGVLCYREDDLERALTAFSKLIIMEPFSENYWMGLASCLHKNDEFEKALSCYAISGLLNEEDPSPHFHAAQIFFNMNDETEFSKALELAWARSTLNAKYMPMQEKIKQLKELFCKKRGAKK